MDVFFVISGFLITRLIQDEVSEGKFSFANFCIRRVRRLMPSLLFTLALSFVFAFLLFSPYQFARFGGALFFTLLSTSNFYFWRESGYFDAVAAYKPLLHTWALAVEAQFYLVWPPVLVVLLRRTSKWVLLWVLIFGGAVSLSLNEFFIERPAAIFYLVPFRVFEFAIGGG